MEFGITASPSLDTIPSNSSTSASEKAHACDDGSAIAAVYKKTGSPLELHSWLIIIHLHCNPLSNNSYQPILHFCLRSHPGLNWLFRPQSSDSVSRLSVAELSRCSGNARSQLLRRFWSSADLLMRK